MSKISAIAVSAFVHGSLSACRGDRLEFPPQTFAELKANRLVAEATADTAAPASAPSPAAPARAPRAQRGPSTKTAPPPDNKKAPDPDNKSAAGSTGAALADLGGDAGGQLDAGGSDTLQDALASDAASTSPPADVPSAPGAADAAPAHSTSSSIDAAADA